MVKLKVTSDSLVINGVKSLTFFLYSALTDFKQNFIMRRSFGSVFMLEQKNMRIFNYNEKYNLLKKKLNFEKSFQ